MKIDLSQEIMDQEAMLEEMKVKHRALCDKRLRHLAKADAMEDDIANKGRDLNHQREKIDTLESALAILEPDTDSSASDTDSSAEEVICNHASECPYKKGNTCPHVHSHEARGDCPDEGECGVIDKDVKCIPMTDVKCVPVSSEKDIDYTP